MPVPRPDDHAKWRTRYPDANLAMREALDYQAEAAEPETWTVALLTKRMCRLWARCDCGVSHAVDMDKLVAEGRGGLIVKDLKLRCRECGKLGHPVLVWKGAGKNNQSCELDFTTGAKKGTWRGACPFRAEEKELREAFSELYAAQNVADGATPTTG